MKGLLSNFRIVKCALLFNEHELIKTLDTVNKRISKSLIFPRWMKLTRCHEFTDKVWRMEFITTGKKYKAIIKELKVKRVWDRDDMPEHIDGKVYSMN